MTVPVHFLFVYKLLKHIMCVVYIDLITHAFLYWYEISITTKFTLFISKSSPLWHQYNYGGLVTLPVAHLKLSANTPFSNYLTIHA